MHRSLASTAAACMYIAACARGRASSLSYQRVWVRPACVRACVSRARVRARSSVCKSSRRARGSVWSAVGHDERRWRSRLRDGRRGGGRGEAWHSRPRIGKREREREWERGRERASEQLSPTRRLVAPRGRRASRRRVALCRRLIAKSRINRTATPRAPVFPSSSFLSSKIKSLVG